MDWLVFVWVAMVAFWIGTQVGERSERKKYDESHVRFAREILSVAKGIRQSRKFVGGGPSIITQTKWKFGDQGEFIVAVSETPPKETHDAN